MKRAPPSGVTLDGVENLKRPCQADGQGRPARALKGDGRGPKKTKPRPPVKSPAFLRAVQVLPVPQAMMNCPRS
ncbi:MAG: hypothetical protein LBU12_01360 [Deltaproteobacteria bacterium]|nr:hypothetical protein [Deltaproteobacteria bacterium]